MQVLLEQFIVKLVLHVNAKQWTSTVFLLTYSNWLDNSTIYNAPMLDTRTAADLGMFSMFACFSRTGAPTRGTVNFLHAGNNGCHLSERAKWMKATVMTKKSPVFQN